MQYHKTIVHKYVYVHINNKHNKTFQLRVYYCFMFLAYGKKGIQVKLIIIVLFSLRNKLTGTYVLLYKSHLCY